MGANKDFISNQNSKGESYIEKRKKEYRTIAICVVTALVLIVVGIAVVLSLLRDPVTKITIVDESGVEKVLSPEEIVKPANKTGYDFAGWVDMETNQVYTTIDEAVQANANRLQEKWNIKKYQLKLYLDGGRIVNDEYKFVVPEDGTEPYYLKEFDIETGKIILPKIAIKDNYTFEFWYKKDSEVAEYLEVPANQFNNIEIIALWSENPKTITMYGRNNIILKSVSNYYFGDTIKEEDFLVNEISGYTFGGYYKDPEYKEKFEFNQKIAHENIIIYTKWIPKQFYITYYDHNEIELDSVLVDLSQNEEVNLKAYEDVLGKYEFMGWFEKDSTEKFNLESFEPNDVSLYAKVKYVDNKIKYIVDGIELKNPKNKSTYQFIDEDISLLDEEKNGYKFSGWYTTSTFDEGTIVTKISTGSTGDKTLYAKFTIIEYTITYNLDGATNAEGNPGVYTVISNDIVLESATKTGYEFSGWYTTSTFDEGTQIETIASGSIGNIILYAKYNALDYIITYNLNDGINNDNNPASYTIESETITLLDATKIGYNFDGWYTTSNFDEGTIVTEISTGSIGDKTLYACFTIIEYTIEYVIAEGATNPNTTNKYTINTENIILIESEIDNYSFDGWYTTSTFEEGTKIEKIEKGSIGNIVLYARYNATEYTITYILNGGANAEENPGVYTVISKDIVLESATKTGYMFSGWYTTSTFDEGTIVTEISTGSTGDKTLYACFTIIEYTIEYVIAEGATNPNTTNKYTINTEDIILIESEIDNYSFDGWYTTSTFDEGTKIEKIKKGSIGNIVLYAKFTATEYTITYNLDGGTNSDENPTSYTVETNTITLESATKKGYEFIGWYTTSTFDEGTIVTEISAGSTGDKTLYAKFTITEYTITYILDGGTNAEENPISYTVETDTITLKNATKTGYEFSGWYTTSTFDEGTIVAEISTGSTGGIELYAKFTAIVYYIYYVNPHNIVIDNTQFTVEDQSISLKTIENTINNYTFDNWYSNENYESIAQNTYVPLEVLGNITVYGNWYTTGLSFKDNTDFYSVTKYNGESTEIFIPKMYNGKRVTTIEEEAFVSEESTITKVIMNDIIIIKANAFDGTNTLVNVEMLNVEEVGSNAFSGTSITELNIKKARIIESNAFAYIGNLKTVYISKNLTKVGISAFFSSGITTTYFEGTQEDFETITISNKNTPLTKNVIYC